MQPGLWGHWAASSRGASGRAADVTVDAKQFPGLSDSVEALQAGEQTPAPQGPAAYLNLRFYNLMKNLPRRKVKSPCPSTCTKFCSKQNKCSPESHAGSDCCRVPSGPAMSPRAGDK